MSMRINRLNNIQPTIVPDELPQTVCPWSGIFGLEKTTCRGCIVDNSGSTTAIGPRVDNSL